MTKRTVSILVVLFIGLGACGGGGSSLSAYCNLAKSDNKKYANIGDSSGDIKTVMSALRDLESKAPSDIKPDLKLVIEDGQKAIDDPSSIAGLDQAKYAAALKNVQKFTLDKCKVDLNG